MRNFLFFSLALMLSNLGIAQVGIGTTTPSSSAVLDLTSTSKGLLFPRVANTNAITGPVSGLMIFDLSANCLKVYQNGVWSNCLGATSGVNVSATCTGFAGDFCKSTLNGASYVVTITNNDYYTKIFLPKITDLTLSGVAGLSVSAVSPNTNIAINPGSSLAVTYTISGIPVTTGTLTGTFSRLMLNCSSAINVVPLKEVAAASTAPTLCINTTLSPITHTTANTTGIGTPTGLPTGVTASWASNTITISGTPTASGTFNYSIPLTGACNIPLNATGTITVSPNLTVTAASANPKIPINYPTNNITHTTISGTGIGTPTGLPSGVGAVWANNTISLTGTPTTMGTYTYTIPVNGCGSSVNATGTITVSCGAAVAAGVYKVFSCHNLGVTTTLDPNVPARGIHGNYYQWGRSTVVADSSIGTVRPVDNWNTADAINGAWSDNSKTSNDPCPEGYRVPTLVQLDGVMRNNTITRTGSWANNNFTTAIHFGPNSSTKTLTLPAAGYLNLEDGTLLDRGRRGNYWSSNGASGGGSDVEFSSTNISASTGKYRSNGMSVRCISE